MAFNRELELYKKLNQQIVQMNNYKKRLGHGPGAQEKASRIEATILFLQDIQTRLASLYTPRFADEPGSYRKLGEKELDELKTLYGNVKTIMSNTVNTLFPDPQSRQTREGRAFTTVQTYIENDEKLLNKINLKDGLSLPEAAYKSAYELEHNQYDDPNFSTKEPGFIEFETLYISAPDYNREDVLRRYIESTPQQIKQEYEQRVSEDAALYEYAPGRENIDPAIRNTGNVEKIDAYLEADAAKQNDEEKLTFRQRQMLIHHRDATKKIDNINNSIQNALQNGNELGAKPTLRVDSEDAAELNVTQPAFQTSANGCWSCAGAMMATSRGIANVSQEDIRSYRPDIPEEEQVFENGPVDENYNTDHIKSMSENADAILKFAPNSMMHTLEIQPFTISNEKDGLTSEEYTENAVTLLKKQIKHAIGVDRSPVAFFQPGHYITITGIEGDIVSCKDSGNKDRKRANPDETLKLPLKKLVENSFFGKNGPQSVEINWLSDISLAKDNKTIHGVPSEYVYLDDDGSVTGQPQEIRNAMGIFENDALRRMGVTVARTTEDEHLILDKSGKNNYSSDGVQMVEKVYLPKKLNAEYLKKMAQKRTQADEDRLNGYDKNIYHIEEGKKDPEQAKAVIQEKLREFERNSRAAEREDEKDDPDYGKEINTGSVAKKRTAIPKVNRHERQSEHKDDENEIGIIDTTSPEKKQKIQEEKRLEALLSGKRLDDSRLDTKETLKKSYMKIFSTVRKRDAQLKFVEQAEKQKAQELVSKYPYGTIKNETEQLLLKLDENKHWYLWGTNNAYKELIGDLQNVRKYVGKAVAQNDGHLFTKEDEKKLAGYIGKARETARKYLSDKQKELEKDPLRRNDPDKMEYEQNRINAVLDAFDALSDFDLSMKGRADNTKDIMTHIDENNIMYEHFRRELVADEKDPQKVREDRLKNRLEIPKLNRSVLDRLDSLYGIVPEFSGKLSGMEDKDKEILKKIESGFPEIGSSNRSKQLTNKDFAAISLAASTTAAGMAGRFVTGDPMHRYEIKDKLSYFAGQNLYNVITANEKNLPVYIKDIQKARIQAKNAMTDYKNGNKDTLAKLLAEGIGNISAMTTAGRFSSNKQIELYAVEMGLRMKNMLERDQELMKKAMAYGLTPGMLKDIKNKGIEAVYKNRGDRWLKEGIKLSGTEWSPRTKERCYVDMLIKRYLEETNEDAEKEMETRPEYKAQLQRIEDRWKREQKDSDNLYKIEKLQALRKTDYYKTIEKFVVMSNAFDADPRNMGMIQGEKLSIRVEVLRKEGEIKKMMQASNKDYEDKLIARHEAYIREHHSQDFEGGYDKADRASILEKALAREKSLVNAAAPEDPEKRKQYDSDKTALSRYDINKTALADLDKAEKGLADRKTSITRARNIGIHTLKNRMKPANPYLNVLSDAGKEMELRNSFLEYIRVNGYTEYSPKKFIENVVGTPEMKQKLRTGRLAADLADLRTRDTGRADRSVRKGTEISSGKANTKPQGASAKQAGHKPAGRSIV